jgi:hypothetical protein
MFKSDLFHLRLLTKLSALVTFSSRAALPVPWCLIWKPNLYFRSNVKQSHNTPIKAQGEQDV